jgi:hypothetical protein
LDRTESLTCTASRTAAKSASSTSGERRDDRESNRRVDHLVEPEPRVLLLVGHARAVR